MKPTHQTISLRCTVEQAASFKSAARRARMPLAAWMRTTLCNVVILPVVEGRLAPSDEPLMADAGAKDVQVKGHDPQVSHSEPLPGIVIAFGDMPMSAFNEAVDAWVAQSPNDVARFHAGQRAKAEYAQRFYVQGISG
jgi:hypothetical protein